MHMYAHICINIPVVHLVACTDVYVRDMIDIFVPCACTHKYKCMENRLTCPSAPVSSFPVEIKVDLCIHAQTNHTHAYTDAHTCFTYTQVVATVVAGEARGVRGMIDVVEVGQMMGGTTNYCWGGIRRKASRLLLGGVPRRWHR
jgi:hypothetical protein